MKYMRVIYVLAAAFTMLNAAAADARNAWETPVTVAAGRIDTQFVIGQKATATDGLDHAADVPFFPGGTLQACSVTDGGLLWKDMRGIATASPVWHIRIDAAPESGALIRLTWSPARFSPETEVTLVDELADIRIDMRKETAYQFPNTGIRYLDIEVNPLR